MEATTGKQTLSLGKEEALADVGKNRNVNINLFFLFFFVTLAKARIVTNDDETAPV